MEKICKIKWRFIKTDPLYYGEAFYVVGNIPELGNWNPAKAHRLEWSDAHNWSVQIDLPLLEDIQYKYIRADYGYIYNNLKWENGQNRKLDLTRVEVEGGRLKVMSFNLRFDNKADGEFSWSHRRQNCLDLILDQLPALIGVQQNLPTMRNFLVEELKQYYHYIGIERDLKQGEEVGIFYLSKKFFLIDYGFVWFNEERKPGVAGFGGRLPRNLTYVLVQDQDDKQKTIMVNTHLDHESQKSRQESIEIILQTIETIITQDKKHRNKPISNIYLTGDFNTDQKDKIFEKLYTRPAIQFLSARKAATTSDQSTTFHNFQGPLYTKNTQIDHIFIHSRKLIRRFRVIKSTAPYYSDHHPILVELQNV